MGSGRRFLCLGYAVGTAGSSWSGDDEGEGKGAPGPSRGLAGHDIASGNMRAAALLFTWGRSEPFEFVAAARGSPSLVFALRRLF